MPLALDCVLGKSQPKVVEYKHKEQAGREHSFPQLYPWTFFGSQGNRGSPMVSGNATSMLLAVTISHINKFNSCFMHFWSCYCMFWLFGISAWGVVFLDIYQPAWLLVLFCVVGLVFPAGAAAPIQAGRAALEVLQQKASGDTSFGIDGKLNGKPADVWLVTQCPTQPWSHLRDDPGILPPFNQY